MEGFASPGDGVGMVEAAGEPSMEANLAAEADASLFLKESLLRDDMVCILAGRCVTGGSKWETRRPGRGGVATSKSTRDEGLRRLGYVDPRCEILAVSVFCSLGVDTICFRCQLGWLAAVAGLVRQA
jgi:hypothetical protein